MREHQVVEDEEVSWAKHDLDLHRLDIEMVALEEPKLRVQAVELHAAEEFGIGFDAR